MTKQEAMSNKKIDHLFRTKLEAHPVSPSPEAWAKLQGKMNPGSRKKGAFWMSVAAAVSMILVAGWFIYRQSTGELNSPNTLAGIDNTEKVTTPENTNPALADDQTPDNMIAETQVGSEETTEVAAANEGLTTESKAHAPAKKINRPVQPATTQVASTTQKEEIKTEALIALEDVNKVTEVTEDITVPETLEIEKIEKSLMANAQAPLEPMEVKITFKADEDEDRFLEPVRELMASDDGKEKKNGFNKLLASARTFSNRDILAELRETKDGLLSGSLKIGITKNEKVNNSK
ncbi:hypothetical protein [Imperialibacter roseus]|uniref:Uncharacterized protein n=1 Tax=Imperialibacter roseus TaxID=1324217 RepID=A0ABZ0IJ35_9BACT|nr:hypothetical protein [Imperialibacter roseus]WOK05040.1 hypothetical protein RT717_18320 [Imperialibacter roseus]|tara:strand:+ start:22306 stop:23178 length:873 start_codon:yes stop_codon:yes gene_type:complete